MEDLSYIVSLGFSGADIPRALIISFFVAMLFAPRRSVWQLGLGALMFDKVAWPLIAQSFAGADPGALFGSFFALFETFFDDLGVYLVRYVGLTILIAAFAAARERLHQLAPTKKAHA